MAEFRMLDSRSESIVVSETTWNNGCEPSSLALGERVVQLFDEERIPLLRYLFAFPLSRQDSEDVVQEIFLELFRHWQRGKSVHNPRGWLFRAAHHLALKKKMQVRRENEKMGPLATIEESAVDQALDPEAQLAHNRRQTRLASVVRALPEQHRWCLHLRTEGLRYREIAEILGVSLGKVALSLQRSLALIARATQR